MLFLKLLEWILRRFLSCFWAVTQQCLRTGEARGGHPPVPSPGEATTGNQTFTHCRNSSIFLQHSPGGQAMPCSSLRASHWGSGTLLLIFLMVLFPWPNFIPLVLKLLTAFHQMLLTNSKHI